MTLPYPETASRFNHISASYTRTLPCGGGWFTVSCDVHQCGAWKWENLRMCMPLGEGMENPHSTVSPSKCRHRNPVRGGVDGARAPWERCWVCACESESLCSAHVSSSSPSFICPATHSMLPSLVSTREGPLPLCHCNVPSILIQFLSQLCRPSSGYKDYLDTCVLEWHWSMFFILTPSQKGMYEEKTPLPFILTLMKNSNRDHSLSWYTYCKYSI